jgi:RAP1 GTPase activating protein 1
LQQQLSQPAVQMTNNGGNNNINNHGKNLCNGQESMQVSNEQQSDNSSLYSVELEPLNDGETRYIDSDPGFGSMSSSEQAQLTSMRQNQINAEQQEAAHQKEVDELKQEITKLKCDKLDLLRQNVVSVCVCVHNFDVTQKFLFSRAQTFQRDMKRLREREHLLQGDLTSASTEIMRLRELLQEFTATAASSNSNPTIITNTTTML